MIDQVDQSLHDWVESVLGDTVVTHELQPAATDEVSVSVYLLQLVPRLEDQQQGWRRPPLRINLRYLITVHAPDPRESHRVLGQLVFAALDTPAYEVDLIPLSLVEWAALGTVPRPGFVLNVPLLRERPEATMHAIDSSARVKTMVRKGQVLGRGDAPLVGVIVEIPDLAFTTRTDRDGRFTLPFFAGITPRVIVRNGRHEHSHHLEAAGNEPLVIRCDL